MSRRKDHTLNVKRGSKQQFSAQPVALREVDFDMAPDKSNRRFRRAAEKLKRQKQSDE